MEYRKQSRVPEKGARSDVRSNTWRYYWRFYNWLMYENWKPYNSFGNGSGMRVSPVGWVAEDLQQCMTLAKWSAEVTHNHPEGIKNVLTEAAENAVSVAIT